MWRKLGWVCRVIYNFIRIPLVYIFSLGKIKCSIIQFLSMKSSLRVGEGGTININKKCMFDEGTLIRATKGKIDIGREVYINRNCNIICRNSISIGNKVTIGPNVCIYDHDHNYKKYKNEKYNTLPILIGNNVWIGANAIILKGIKIGDNCIVGAGTIVTKSILDNTVIYLNNDIISKRLGV